MEKHLGATPLTEANSTAHSGAVRAPVVSVIMPCYNRSHFMRQAIRSVLAQTFTDFEFIIVDNGSQDPAVYATAQEFATQDPRIVLHREPVNLGISGGQQCALQMAQGRYIVTIQDDDFWRADKLQKQVAFMQANPNVGIFSCSHNVIDEDGREIGKHLLPDGISPQSTDIADIGNNLGRKYLGSGWILRHDLFRQCGGFTPFFNHADDVDIFHRMQEIGDTATSSECLIYFRKWQGNSDGEAANRAMSKLYTNVAKIAAYHRRANLPDHVSQGMHLDDFLIRFFHPSQFGEPKAKWHAERRVARALFTLGKYSELRRFLRVRPSGARPHILRLYAKIFLWQFKFKRFGFWLGGSSKGSE